MAQERVRLTAPAGYDSAANPRVASFAAQLDDQLRLLKKRTAGLEVEQLEWQIRPGTNTIGMLLAHLAIVDLWWMHFAPRNPAPESTESGMRRIIGIGMDDDGLPVPAEGLHAKTLAGWTLQDYFRILDAARAQTHRELSRWTDAGLADAFVLQGEEITYEWTAYHVLEHFAAHAGQIQLLQHLMRYAHPSSLP